MYAARLKNMIEERPGYDILAPVLFNMVCFRYHPEGMDEKNELNRLNEELLRAVNGTGRAYLSHAMLDNNYVLRMAIGQTHVAWRHVEETWELICEESHKLFERTRNEK